MRANICELMVMKKNGTCSLERLLYMVQTETQYNVYTVAKLCPNVKTIGF